ncbi:transmembrane protein [Cryptosporidium felis]|nr:transmembrane protein [Cryptosporidium felis]
MLNNTKFILLSDYFRNCYYDLVSSVFCGKKFNKIQLKPEVTTNDAIKLLLWLFGWLFITLVIPLCGVILAYSVSPSRIDIVPAVFQENYLVISNPLLRTNSQSQVVTFTASLSILFEIKYVNRLFVDNIFIEGVEIAYIGKIPINENNIGNCNSNNIEYLFPKFPEHSFTKIPNGMFNFVCDNYSNCRVEINIGPLFSVDSYNEDSFINDSKVGYSNFVIRTSFKNSHFISSLVSGKLGFRYTPFSIPIRY